MWKKNPWIYVYHVQCMIQTSNMCSSPGWQAASIPYSSTRILPRYRKQECWWAWYRLIIYKHTHRDKTSAHLAKKHRQLHVNVLHVNFLWKGHSHEFTVKFSIEITSHEFYLKFSHMNFTWKHLCKLDTIKSYHMHLPCNLLFTWNVNTLLTWISLVNLVKFMWGRIACVGQQFMQLKKSLLLVGQIQSSTEHLHKYFDNIWGTYMSPDVLTWLTRGVSKSADCFPRHLITNRIQRQHLSVIRTSPWYLSHARESTGQTCWKT